MPRFLRTRSIFSVFAFMGAVFCLPITADAYSPYLVVPAPHVAENSPAYRYANMTNDEAFAELDRRHTPYVREESTLGVRAPVRLTGRLHGVYIHSTLPVEQRATTPFEVLDARLALALDDFAEILEKHDIDELIHYTMYRPNGPSPTTSAENSRQRSVGRKTAPSKAKATTANRKKVSRVAAISKKNRPAQSQKGIAKKTKELSTAAAPHSSSTPKSQPRLAWAPPGTRHPAGLAIDVAILRKKDGSVLNVSQHFHGKIGAKTCGEGAYPTDSESSKELRALVCEADQLGIFTYTLTPNYNAAHADHYHMEIKPGVKWFLTN